MGSRKTEQRHVNHRGRRFHFVSYEGQAANPGRLQPATGPSWFLMSSGKRWHVMPHDADQTDEQLDGLLAQWLEANVFA